MDENLIPSFKGNGYIFIFEWNVYFSNICVSKRGKQFTQKLNVF